MASLEGTTLRGEGLKMKDYQDSTPKEPWLKSEASQREACEMREEEFWKFIAVCSHRNSNVKISEVVKSSFSDIITMKDKNGKTGTSWACSSGNLKALKELVQIDGVDVNDPDNEGNTPLMLAAQAGYDEIVRFMVVFLRNQIEIDAQNYSGYTALMKAALNGKTNCTRMLLIQGADVMKQDWGKGLRADEWASFCGRHETASAIKSVATCKLSEEQVLELKWEKKRNSVVEFCNSTIRYIRRKFNMDRDEWQATAGSLYHLTSHASALGGRLTAVKMPDGLQQGRSHENTMRCVDVGGRGEDTLIVESCDYGNNKVKQTITQRCHKRPEHGFAEATSPSITRPVPEVTYLLASPKKKQKKKEGPQDENHLQVPKRKKKKKSSE